MSIYHDDLLTRPLTDEAAYELWQFLGRLSLAIEKQYLESIRRHDRKITKEKFKDEFPF